MEECDAEEEGGQGTVGNGKGSAEKRAEKEQKAKPRAQVWGLVGVVSLPTV